MEKSTVVLFYEKCRLCLEEPGACNVFETGGLARDIFSCTGVQISPSDNLPQKICTNCSDTVSKAKKLRLLATKNDCHLRSLFNDDDECEEITKQVTAAVEDILSNSKACVGDNKKDNKNTKTKSSSQPSNQNVTAAVEDILSSSKACVGDNKKDSKNTKTKSSSQPSNQNCEKTSKTISIRKDLFESSTVVSSSTKRGSSKEQYDAHGQRKRIKWEIETVEYECEVCFKKFQTWKKLYLHLRSHNKSMACPLDACGKKFATKGDLEKHLRTHTGVKPYQCHICDKSFTQQVTLKAHKENVHHCFETAK